MVRGSWAIKVVQEDSRNRHAKQNRLNKKGLSTCRPDLATSLIPRIYLDALIAELSNELFQTYLTMRGSDRHSQPVESKVQVPHRLGPFALPQVSACLRNAG